MHHLTLSLHALRRCQQRGIRRWHLDLIVRYGHRRPWFDGAVIYYMGVRQLTKAVSTEPRLKRHWEHLNGMAVIVSPASGEVMTAFKERDGISQIARNYRGKSRGAAFTLIRQPEKDGRSSPGLKSSFRKAAP